MASANVKERRPSIVDEWLDEDHLMLLECWARDGYTYQDIAKKIGITTASLAYWRRDYPEIATALRNGREIIDYKVENALLKSALGYKTRESKIIMELDRRGKLVETRRETVSKEVAPNVTACQVWLYNRIPDKWKKNRDAIVELDENDSTIQISITRGKENLNRPKGPEDESTDADDDWQDEVNPSITVSKKEEPAKPWTKKGQQQLKEAETKVPSIDAEQDLDYWPDDWEE